MQSQADIEELLCALMHLLTREASCPRGSRAPAIRRHLTWLLTHPGTREQPILRKTCRLLLLHWQRAEGSSGTGGKVGLMAPAGNVH